MKILFLPYLLIFVLNGIFLWKLILLFQKKPEILLQKPKSMIAVSLFSLFQFFLAFFGISNFAMGSIFYSKFKHLEVKKIPGTLNAAAAIPVATIALFFLTRVEIDIPTLFVAIIMQSIGAFFTPQLVAKIDERFIKKLLLLGLVVVAVKFFASDLQSVEDMSMSLRGLRLVIFGLLCAFFGMFNNFGICSFALTTYTAYFMGLSPSAALPIMACAAAISIPLASIRFIKQEMVSSSVAILSAVMGTTGFSIAAFVVKDLNLNSPIFGIIFIVCAIAMLTNWWWKNLKQTLDVEFQSFNVSFIGLMIVAFASFSLSFELGGFSYKQFTELRNSAVWQQMELTVSPLITDVISYIFIFLFFMFLVLIGFSLLLFAEINRHEKTKVISLIDPLTGIANRRAFLSKIQNEWNRLAREQVPMSFLMLDLDKFKNYNDTYGHLQGDEFLKALAFTIKKCCRRPADFAVRLGGEEFGILLPNVNLANAINFAENLRKEVEQISVLMLNGGEPVGTTASIGVASIVPSNDVSYKILMNTADSMLYKAKNSGRNKVCS